MDIRKLAEAGVCNVLGLPVWGNELARVAAQYQIDDNPTRLNMWLAQISYESAHCNHTEENLNYSAERLLAVFPHYFSESEARLYAHNPRAIGSRVYANRMGNGDEASGEGYTYRGRGLIMLTGKTMYAAFGDAIGMRTQILATPDLIATPQYAAESAGWYWQAHGCNELADTNDFVAVTRKINGGLNGLAGRESLYAVVQSVFVA